VSGKRHICVWSGKRGGFGALLPTMRAIAEHPALRLSVVVTDQHLYERFGRTISEVAAQVPIAAAIDMEQEGDSNADRARAIGRCLVKSVDVLQDLAPDILLVIGDRGEVFAATIAAHNLGIAIAHIQGGDVSGTLDERVRHAITKLAHIHFPSTQRSAERILAMGEEPWRVHTVGDTHIDQILLGSVTAPPALRQKYDLPEGEPFLLVLQHSDSTSPHASRARMEETAAAVLATKLRALFVYPCSDQGYQGIIDVLDGLRGMPRVSVHENIPAPDFVGLQAIAGALVGNSSAGLIEAPYFGLPTVDVGDRQTGREHAENVIHVGYDRSAIGAAIDRALHDARFRETCRRIKPPFGDGTAWRRITECLASVELGPRLLDKRMTY
jgi:UDP-hydrolysing UDP-N-acetyl-D-glucosamine 2-epimerase